MNRQVQILDKAADNDDLLGILLAEKGFEYIFYRKSVVIFLGAVNL